MRVLKRKEGHHHEEWDGCRVERFDDFLDIFKYDVIGLLHMRNEHKPLKSATVVVEMEIDEDGIYLVLTKMKYND